MLNIIKITDFSAQELDIYARKTEVQLLNREHPEDGIFIAESPKVIERALNAGFIPVSFLVEGKHIYGEALPILKRCEGVPIYTADLDVLTQLTGFQLTRGMLCAMRRKALPTLSQLCDNAKRIAILENVMNPTNIGAIFRSAAALGMDGVILTEGSSNPLYRRSIRVSMGTVFQIPWTFCADANEIKKYGFQTVAMALRNDSISIDDPWLAAQERLAIILGTEGDGLAEQTITACDHTVRIPMAHGVDSLNVAAASAVAFWQLGRKREDA
ncbi:MAG: RNA methyltransferase [Ruminococcaceae bacterium]|nr:RNA methyltransferase [Oscillospiraceae bacterium]